MACVCIGGAPSAAVGTSLVDSMMSRGYVYVQHPKVSPALIRDIKAAGRNLFRKTLPGLSEFNRQSLRTEIGFRGTYRYVGASGKDDPIDCFSVGREVAEPHKLREAYYRAAGWERDEMMNLIGRSNNWHLLGDEDLRRTCLEYYDACHDVSMDVLRNVAAALGVKPSGGEEVDLDYFARGHSMRDHNLELKHYPSIAELTRKPLVEVRGAQVNRSGPKILRRQEAKAFPTGQREVEEASGGDLKVRLDAHRDLSTVTLLAQDQLGGLEVFDVVEEKYIPVPVLEDALLVNAGTFLEKWTSGMLEATMHRVRVVDGAPDRCSVVFFCFPNFDHLIEPLQLGDGEEVGAPFQAGDSMPTH
jgi:isopenicillin N synthase-like dioxygenase